MRTEKIDNCYLPHFFGLRFGIFFYRKRVVKVTFYSMLMRVSHRTLFESNFGIEERNDGGHASD